MIKLITLQQIGRNPCISDKYMEDEGSNPDRDDVHQQYHQLNRILESVGFPFPFKPVERMGGLYIMDPPTQRRNFIAYECLITNEFLPKTRISYHQVRILGPGDKVDELNTKFTQKDFVRWGLTYNKNKDFILPSYSGLFKNPTIGELDICQLVENLMKIGELEKKSTKQT